MHIVRHGSRRAAASTAQTQSSTERAPSRPSGTDPKQIALRNGNRATTAEAALRRIAARRSRRLRSLLRSRNLLRGPALIIGTIVATITQEFALSVASGK